MIIAGTAVAGAMAGCGAPTAPVAPPAGGVVRELDFARYETQVAPVLSARGCDAGGDCHGGGIRGTLALSPADAKDARFDFEQVALQVSAADPDGSPVLTEPLALAAGGTPHPYKAFADTSDAGYQAIRAWIRAGTLR